jgi:hypothetical protein
MSWIGKLRPQILVAMIALAGIAGVAMTMLEEPAIEVATGCVGGMIALGMKLLENE